MLGRPSLGAEQQPDPTNYDIHIDYHPKSQRRSMKVFLEDFRTPKPSAATAPLAPSLNQATPDSLPNENLYGPFNSKSEFMFAKLVLEGSLSSSHIDVMCQLIAACTSGKDTFNIKNCADLKHRLDEVALLMPTVRFTLLLVASAESIVH